MQELANSAATTTRSAWQNELAANGWAIVRGFAEPTRAERALGELGELREQYGAVLRHQVKAKPGFDHLQYTHSRNGITPHTEAPGLPSPPRYVALHCHRQARCGGGHTLLADGYAMIAALEPTLRDEAQRRPIRFDLVRGADSDSGLVAAPILAPVDGDQIPTLRYSYSVLRDNSVSAPVHDDLEDLEDLDPFHAAMCKQGLEHMESEGFGALPGDGELLIFDNWRMIHARDTYTDPERHLTRYWVG